MNRKEAYKAMIDGKRVTNKKWTAGAYAFAREDASGLMCFMFRYDYDDREHPVKYLMELEDGYEIVKEKVKMYAFLRIDGTLSAAYRSKRDLYDHHCLSNIHIAERPVVEFEVEV